MLSKLRDPFSSLSHLAGAVLAIYGLIYMLIRSSDLTQDYGYYLASYLVFGISLIMMFAASAVYHWPKLSENTIRQLKRVDHIAIFILIAGTYTPFCLIALKDGIGWWLFGIAWGIALAGTFMKVFWLHAPRWLSTALYLAMGWICIFAIQPLSEALSTNAMIWLVAGGAFYSIGALVYAFKWPDPWPDVFGFHDIWHLFVIAGAASHYVSIAFYL